ncbi:MAG TPA: hypothetical protein VFK86_08020 [Bauldia sp.]|nr:hypothetical protein [Bauldia sp.]
MDTPEAKRGDDARLAIFRLVPTASRNDRRQARGAFHGEVVVRAYSAEDARTVACEAEMAAGEGDPNGDSPFRDADRYTVIEVPGVDFLRSGKRGLIAGRFAAKAAVD